MNELVSVIIPTYKRNENLKKAIESVLKQTYQNIEIIVVDDNNPDTRFRKDNEKIMECYLTNSKVKYIKHKKNKNGAAARNTGINVANGKYIGFLDDDDEFLPTKIEKQVHILESEKKYNCVSCQIFRNHKVEKQNINEKNLLEDILSLKVAPITSTLLFRKEALLKLNGFNELYRRHQDVEIMVRYLQSNKLAYIQEPLIIMGINNGENQLNGKALKEMKENFLKEFMPIIEELDNEKNGCKKKIICSHYVGMTINFLKNREIGLTNEMIKKAIKEYPLTYLKILIISVAERIIIHIKWRKNGKDKEKFE